MVQKIFAIYDRKSQIYRFPNFYRNEGQAARSLLQACTDLQTEIGRFPADFELYELGSWDDERGILYSIEKPIFVVSAQTLFLQTMKMEKQGESYEA